MDITCVGFTKDGGVTIVSAQKDIGVDVRGAAVDVQVEPESLSPSAQHSAANPLAHCD